MPKVLIYQNSNKAVIHNLAPGLPDTKALALLPEGITSYYLGEQTEAQTLARSRWDTELSFTAPDILSISVAHARIVRLSELRKWRDNELDRLDKPEQIAWSKGDDAELATVRAEKTWLRQVPAQAEAELALMGSLEEIAAYQPQRT